jgi:lipopolysaccharide export system protein LptA
VPRRERIVITGLGRPSAPAVRARSMAIAACTAICLLVARAGTGVAQGPAAPLVPRADAGRLADLPARGLAATIAAAGRIEVPAVDPRERLTIRATQASRWTEGSYDVWHLTGGVRITQGTTEAAAHEAVVWIEQEQDPQATGVMPPEATGVGEDNEPPITLRGVLVRMAGDVEVRSSVGDATAATVRGDDWAGRFRILRDPTLDFTSIVATAGPPPVYDGPAGGDVQLVAATDPGDDVALAQFGEFAAPAVPQAVPVAPARRLRAFPRSSVPLAIKWFPSPSGGEWIAVITSGVNLVVDGVDPAGPLDISADRLVIWTQGQAQPDLGGSAAQSPDTPLELYMEGNVIFRQGQRVVEAANMFYDVPRSSGVITGATVLTPVDNYSGLVRLRADVLRQVDRSRFVAQQTGLTSSRLGVPSWEFRSRELSFTDEQVPIPGPFGQPLVDPATGEPQVEHQQFITARGNTVTLGGVPVLWWPVLSTNAQKPTFYINNAQVKNDQIFGTQVLTSWDAFQVFGWQRPPDGVDWDFDIDYLSLRGPGGGTSLLYNRPDFLWLGTPASGDLDAWFVGDVGRDNLGLFRRDLTYPGFPDRTFRGRSFWRHRQDVGMGWQARATAGWISDLNFLEEYYEAEWEEGYEQRTWLDLRRPLENRELRLLTSVRVNPFFSQTEWWPRLDHYWMGQPLVRDSVSWYAHSNVAYARQSLPQAPIAGQGNQFWTLLPYEANVIGERLATRHELDLPFQAGAVKVVPYALGELAHWGEALDQDPLSRAYGQVGIRSSLPMWWADDTVESQLWNVHGLAHKAVLEAEFAYTNSTQSIDEFPLYDQIDDDAINQYRRNIPYWDYGVPFGDPVGDLVFGPDFKYDPRSYAVRRGMAGWVTGPTEIANDLSAFRVGAHQRWQTKRGPIGNRRIIDWITLDIDGEFFPVSGQNFGTAMGLWQYDFRWHVGDRTTVLSSADVDFFSGGQQLYTVGALLNRTPRGSLYLGFQQFGGPISASVLAGSYTYRMSPKWASSFGSAIDLTGRNIGQNFQLVRIGESFLMTFGFNVDYSRNNVGVTFNLEPRFLSRTQFASRTGLDVPMAGTYGLE